ncbi:hypothetical protein NL676_036393 [Syzygium grande]|nr:hypothetical protein NL676_036393 [Syzygium grande]
MAEECSSMISVQQYLSKEHAMVEPVIVATRGWRWIRGMVSCGNDRHLGTNNGKEISTYVDGKVKESWSDELGRGAFVHESSLVCTTCLPVLNV